MLPYIVRRSFLAIGTIWAISILVFAVIEMPPGDAATTKIEQYLAQGVPLGLEQAEALRVLYGLDRPMLVRYVSWIKGLATGRLGVAFRPLAREQSIPARRPSNRS